MHGTYMKIVLVLIYMLLSRLSPKEITRHQELVQFLFINFNILRYLLNKYFNYSTCGFFARVQLVFRIRLGNVLQTHVDTERTHEVMLSLLIWV